MNKRERRYNRGVMAEGPAQQEGAIKERSEIAHL